MSATAKSGSTPAPCRSSGTTATPAASASAGERKRTGRPKRRSVPDLRREIPQSSSTSSVRPAPARPARPRISPARSRNDARFTRPPSESPSASSAGGAASSPRHGAFGG